MTNKYRGANLTYLESFKKLHKRFNPCFLHIQIISELKTYWESEFAKKQNKKKKTGSLTYEEAERRRAGWEGCEKLQNAEAGLSHVQVVVRGTLFTAQLLQPPPLSTVRCILHQRSQECLTEIQESDVASLEAALTFQFPSLASHSAVNERHFHNHSRQTNRARVIK